MAAGKGSRQRVAVKVAKHVATLGLAAVCESDVVVCPVFMGMRFPVLFLAPPSPADDR